MTGPARRGWCPSLATPMATGDGLLARFYPHHGLLSAPQLAGVAEAARRHGNGLIEITMRGNLQIRGLRSESVRLFEDAVLTLGIEPEPAPEIRTAPPPGLAAATIAGLRGMAARLRLSLDAEGLAGRLSPKFAILIDAAAAPDLAGTSADIRLLSLETGRWAVSVAGDRASARQVFAGDVDGAAEATLSLVRKVASLGEGARARDLKEAEAFHAPGSGRIPAHPSSARTGAQDAADGGRWVRLALAFGQIESEALADFCRALPASASLCLAPGGALLVEDPRAGGTPVILRAAEQAGMVTRPDDPRLSVLACAGAPACASGRLATSELARRIVAEAADLVAGRRLYLAGCAKRCARPETPHVAIVGEVEGVSIDAVGGALRAADRARLAALAARRDRR